MKFVAAGVSAFGMFVVLRAFFYELGGSVADLPALARRGDGDHDGRCGRRGRASAGCRRRSWRWPRVAALFVYLRLDAIPDEFVPMLPYVVTLVVVSSRGQALRPPAAAGEPWFKGQQT